MYDTNQPSKAVLNRAEYQDKVLGCWTGKNIGGTIGAPFEGHREMNGVTFYTEDLQGNPAPNDDLDLQLVWLAAIEANGLAQINERVLGEYWLSHITGPWNEYGVCKSNMRDGLVPPLSGACNNDKWKWSNGAWIRSEIWACLFPGSPDEAAQYAYYDSCCDHSGEGIYAEIFTAAMESAAFAVNDVRSIIDIGLARIPAGSRVARAVKLAIECYDTKTAFQQAREIIVKDSSDLGFFQAPGNLGFVILGLLYGEGDFGKSVALATNCGDDTDCTAGTVGAILGILKGRSGIPQNWIDPIGEKILTCSIDTYNRNNILPYPATLSELTERVMFQAGLAQQENGTLVKLADEPTAISAEYVKQLHSGEAVKKRIWGKAEFEVAFDLPFGVFTVEYPEGPYVTPGKELKLKFKFRRIRPVENMASVKILLPSGWQAVNTDTVRMALFAGHESIWPVSVIPGDLADAVGYLSLEIHLADRFTVYPVNIPLQRPNSVLAVYQDGDQPFWDRRNQYKSLK